MRNRDLSNPGAKVEAEKFPESNQNVYIAIFFSLLIVVETKGTLKWK
jgi:hypothetical protein